VNDSLLCNINTIILRREYFSKFFENIRQIYLAFFWAAEKIFPAGLKLYFHRINDINAYYITSYRRQFYNKRYYTYDICIIFISIELYKCRLHQLQSVTLVPIYILGTSM